MSRFFLWPKALTGQIAACVILALLLTQGLTGLLAISLQPRHSSPPFTREIAARIALILDALDAAPASDRSRIAAVVGKDGIVVAIGATGERRAEPSHSETAESFARLVQERVSTPIILAVSEDKPAGGEESLISLRARLTDGSLVDVAGKIMPPPNFVEFSLRPFLFYLPFVALLIAVLTVWATRRVIAPLRDFADAAQRLGNERAAPPLVERGAIELQRAARSFNKMQDQLKRFVEDRTRMLAAISHDMRTPITRLRLRVETVVEDETEQQKMLQDLDRMDAMIASALSFARDGGRDEQEETVDLASLLQSICDDFSDVGYNIRYVGAMSFPIRCRPTMLSRAITNLVENATKFASETTVDLRRDAANNAIILIDDNGPGIPAKEKVKAFDPFYRLDPSRNSETGGVGLGLSIAKTIVENHAGRIELVDLQPTGLRALVVLPTGQISPGADRASDATRIIVD